MRRNLCVVSLLLLAAASAAGAWLLQPPSLRSVDLASVRGGDPPLDPCTKKPKWDGCDDLLGSCHDLDGTATCHSWPCSRCSNVIPFCGLIDADDSPWLKEADNNTVSLVICGVRYTPNSCEQFPEGCFCALGESTGNLCSPGWQNSTWSNQCEK